MKRRNFLKQLFFYTPLSILFIYKFNLFNIDLRKIILKKKYSKVWFLHINDL